MANNTVMEYFHVLVGLVRNKISPTVKSELVYMCVGGLIGLTVHEIAKATLEYKRRQKRRKPSVERRRGPRQIVDIVLALRAGELASSGLLVKLIVAALESVAAEQLGTLIVGMAGGTAVFLTQNGRLIQEASISGLYTRALTPIHYGVPILGSILESLRNVICQATESYMVRTIFSDTSDQNKINTVERYIDRAFKPGSTLNERLNFVMCIATILISLFIANRMGVFATIIEALYEAYKEGRIDRKFYLAILRMLKRKGIPLDPSIWPEPLSATAKSLLEIFDDRLDLDTSLTLPSLGKEITIDYSPLFQSRKGIIID